MLVPEGLASVRSMICGRKEAAAQLLQFCYKISLLEYEAFPDGVAGYNLLAVLQAREKSLFVLTARITR
jgi:hypothetical protein